MDKPRYWIEHWKHIYDVSLLDSRRLGWSSWEKYCKIQVTKGQKCTRFKVVYGRAPPSVARFIPADILVEAVAPCLVERDEALKQLKYQLRAQDHMTRYANAHWVTSKIKVGDWIYFTICHQDQVMPTRLYPKLATRYYEPYKVIKQIGVVALQLQIQV